MTRWSSRFLVWLVLAVGGIAAARAEGVVLSSTAPGIGVGRVVADDESLHLPADSLTVLLLASGQVLTLAGPYDGKAASPPGPAEQAGVVALEDWRRPDLSSLGAGRGDLMPAMGMPDTAVVIDASNPGDWCVGAGAALRLAAPKTVPAVLHLEAPAGEGSATIAWPPAVGEQPWPAALQVRDGALVTARWGDSGRPQWLRLHMPADDGGNPSARLVAWSRAGCARQVEPQLRGLGARLAPFALYLSTDRGRTPRYALGEPVNLILQVNRPSVLHCFVVQDGRVRPVFSGKPGGLAMPDQTETRITADRLPVDITAPPPRLAELRCYAVSAAAAPSLVVDWEKASSPADLPGGRLDRIFAALPDGEVARAHLLIRTE